MLLALAFHAAAGRAERAEVAGYVFRDGLPLPDLKVTFVPEADEGTIRAVGITDADGRFQLTSEDQRAGIVAGKYRVIVEDMRILNAPRKEDGTLLERPPVRFPSKYHDLLKSPLHQEIQKGFQQVVLKLAGSM